MHDGGGGGGGHGGFSGGGHGGFSSGHHGGHSSGHYSPGAGGHHLHQAYRTEEGTDAYDPEFPDRRARYSMRRGQPGYPFVRIAVRLIVLAFVAYWIYMAVH